MALYGCADNGATLTSLTLWANTEYIRGMAVRLLQPILTASAVHSITVSLASALEWEDRKTLPGFDSSKRTLHGSEECNCEEEEGRTHVPLAHACRPVCQMAVRSYLAA